MPGSMKGENCVDTSTFSEVVPYVEVCIGGHFSKTALVHGHGKNPVWNEAFDFEMLGNETAVTIKLMHHHAITRDREVSKADIPMYDMLSGQVIEKRVQTFSAKGEAEGTILCLFQYTPLAGTANAAAPMAPQQQYQQYQQQQPPPVQYQQPAPPAPPPVQYQQPAPPAPPPQVVYVQGQAPQPMYGQPMPMYGQPQMMGGQPQMMMGGQPQMMMGGQPQMMMGGQPQMMMGQNQLAAVMAAEMQALAALEGQQAMMMQQQAQQRPMYGQPVYYQQ